MDGRTSVAGIIAQGWDDEDMVTGKIGETELSTVEPSPMDIEEIIGLLDEDSSMDGTPPASNLPLGEPIDQMGYLFDTGQVDDYPLDMDFAEHIDQLEDGNDDFSVDAIGLDGATPAVTNLLIHGIINEAGEMPMPPVRDS